MKGEQGEHILKIMSSCSGSRTPRKVYVDSTNLKGQLHFRLLFFTEFPGTGLKKFTAFVMKYTG